MNSPKATNPKFKPISAPMATVSTCRTFEGAMRYPYRMAQWQNEPADHHTKYPAQLLAVDGTYPMICVIEVRARPECVLELPNEAPKDLHCQDLLHYLKLLKEKPNPDTVHLQHTESIWIAVVYYYYACEPAHATQQQASAKHLTVRTSAAAATLLSNSIKTRDGTVVTCCPGFVNEYLGTHCHIAEQVHFTMTTEVQERSRSHAHNRSFDKLYFHNEYYHRNRAAYNLIGAMFPVQDHFLHSIREDHDRKVCHLNVKASGSGLYTMTSKTNNVRANP